MAAKPLYYSVAPEATAQLPLLIKDSCLTPKLREFLTLLVSTCQDRDLQRINRQEFIKVLQDANHASSAGLIGKRFKELEQLGVLKESDCFIRGKASRIIELTNLMPVLAHFANENRSALIPSHRPSREQLSLAIDQLEIEGSYLSLSDDVPPRIESLFCILDAGMKLSGRDKRKDIRCKYQFFENDYIEIRTSTQTREGSDVAYLSDERAMRALNGILLDQLESRFGSLDQFSVTDLGIKDEYFFFDLYELCRRMGLRPNDQNRRIVRDMLARLRDTEFKVDASQSAYFRENFTFGAETAHYRYITEFYAKKDYEHDDKGNRVVTSDRFYMVKFHTAILANLVSGGRSFISHDGLMSERSGLAHRLNNWAKAVVGVRPKPASRPFTYTLDEFGERVIPSARMDNFERDFLSLIRRQCNEVDDQGCPMHEEATTGWREEGANVGWLYGYYYKIEWDEGKIQEHRRMRRRRNRTSKLYPLITIWRDTSDFYVGDDSDHNKALRRQAAALVTLTVMDHPWTPTANARLTLKQLGLSATQIQEAISAYCRQAGDNSERSDQAFMRFARQTTEAPALERRLTEVLGIALDWRPPKMVLERLEAAGYHPAAIEHYRTLFVVSAREQGRALRDPGRAFFVFCSRRATRLHAPMPTDWLPRTDTLQRLVREQRLDSGRIPELIECFLHTHQDRLSPDWDRAFAAWVERAGEGRAQGGAAC